MSEKIKHLVLKNNRVFVAVNELYFEFSLVPWLDITLENSELRGNCNHYDNDVFLSLFDSINIQRFYEFIKFYLIFLEF